METVTLTKRQIEDYLMTLEACRTSNDQTVIPMHSEYAKGMADGAERGYRLSANWFREMVNEAQK